MKKKSLFLLFLGIGIFILIQAFMPFVSYSFWEITDYQQNVSLISPDSKSSVLGVSIQNINDFPALVSKKNRSTESPYSEFILTIPSLKLENIKVKVDSNDFEQNLAHLPGTALPGEKGNVFITGHSSLPQFFKSNNFKAIFAHLPEIKKGESIFIEADGQKFEYIIQGLKIVDPSQTWVINPPDNDGRYLSLMTCVPPGLYLKRLIVLAELK